MKVSLLQLDGKLPNRALMAACASHRAIGDEVQFSYVGTESGIDSVESADRIYASLIFEKTRPIAERLRARFPHSIIGGTGWDLSVKMEDYGVLTDALDYSIYPDYQFSMDFSQRGCRLSCSFCHVPKAEGRVRPVKTIHEIWRGAPWPKKIVLLDNDFFGQPEWRERIREIREGRYKVNFCQGINSRLIDDEAAEALASVPYYDSKFERRQLYTAWDAREDEERLFKGLNALVRHGVKSREIMVYVLVGYDHHAKRDAPHRRRDFHPDDLYRQERLRAFGAVPYPMPYERECPEPGHRARRDPDCHRCERGRVLIGFQRWCVGAYDKRVLWADWAKASYRPEKLNLPGYGAKK